VKYDKRDLRFSSYAHENNVKSVEKMLFKNMYLPSRIQAVIGDIAID
jgi:hypothetical protein